MDCSFPGAAYNEKYGSSSTAGSTEKGGLHHVLQLLLGSAVIGNGECGRHEMKSRQLIWRSTVVYGAWRIVNEGDVDEDRMY